MISGLPLAHLRDHGFFSHRSLTAASPFGLFWLYQKAEGRLSLDSGFHGNQVAFASFAHRYARLSLAAYVFGITQRIGFSSIRDCSMILRSFRSVVSFLFASSFFRFTGRGMIPLEPSMGDGL